MLLRKRKINEQLIFNQETIQAIVDLDKKLTNYCRELKNEAESLFSQIQEYKRGRFNLNSKIIIDGNDSFIDCGISVMNDHLLSFGITSCDKIENLNLHAIFDFNSNFTDKILPFSTQQVIKSFDRLAGCHIGYAFYELYHNSCLSLQDMLEIKGLQREIDIHYFSGYEKL